MRLRIQLNGQTSRVELPGAEPTLVDLRLQVQEILLPSHGLHPDTEFTLSLNGREPLLDLEDAVLQTLSSRGVVSGHLICVLPLSTTTTAAVSPALLRSVSSNTCSGQTPFRQHRQTNTMDATPSSSGELGGSGQSARVQDAAGTPEWVVPIWEPVLCMEAEEGRVPRSLEVLHRGAQSGSPADCLMVAVHLLMLESGFAVLPRSSPDGGETTTTMTMPAGWREAGGAYRLNYTHPLCEGSLVMLNVVSMGAKLINGTLRTETATTAISKPSLSLSGFVSAEWAAGSGGGAAAAFTGTCTRHAGIVNVWRL